MTKKDDDDGDDLVPLFAKKEGGGGSQSKFILLFVDVFFPDIMIAFADTRLQFFSPVFTGRHK